MKSVEVAMEDLKASIAAQLASVYKRRERISAVAETLQIDEDEARALVARGRRLARQRVEKVA